MFIRRGVLIVLLLNYNIIVSAENDKSSLTFVIDDTGSMWEEIHQVKESVNAIFDAVANSKDSQIEDFIIVTFNDPDAELRTVTKSREEFKEALSLIEIHGGGDCPEYAMSGIKLALEASKPRSNLYVFTDASAKDYRKYDTIKYLAAKQESQVVFLLTGRCGGQQDADYAVYHSLAAATGGQVFHMQKQDIADILTYIKDSIKGRRTLLANKRFPAGEHNFTYTVDGKTKDTTISVSGTNPKVDVTGPAGVKPATEVLTKKNTFSVIKVNESAPGDYDVTVSTSSGGSVVVTAKSEVHFTSGFSKLKPTRLDDTSTRPFPDVKSYIAIQLTEGDITLTSVVLLDMDDNIINEVPLYLLDNKEKLYRTDPTATPKSMFRIAIKGIDPDTKTVITRIGSSPIEPQILTGKEEIESRSPTVDIYGQDNMLAEYDKPFQIRCKVSGYPKPDIVWQDKDTGMSVPASTLILDLPYDHVSFIEISHVKYNKTYTCKASNYLGSASADVTVKTRKPYLIIRNKPTHHKIKYHEEGRITCDVDSYPTASITWYKDNSPLSGDNIGISDDYSTVTIKMMEPENAGDYVCVANTKYHSEKLELKVSVIGIVPATIVVPVETNLKVNIGNRITLTCNAQGVPKPDIKWVYHSFDQRMSKKYQPPKNAPMLVLNEIQVQDEGYYTCEATNVGGTFSITYEVHVYVPPKMVKQVERQLYPVKGDVALRINCEATGIPKPSIKWSKQGVKEAEGTLNIEKDGTLVIDNVPLSATGVYICEAKNVVGKDFQYYEVKVLDSPRDEIQNLGLKIEEKESSMVPCPIHQKNTELLRWYRNGSMIATGELVVDNAKLSDSGLYTCRVSDSLQSISTSIKITVGSKPKFVTNEIEDLELDQSTSTFLYCDAVGEPRPQYTWWHNGQKQNWTDEYFFIKMKLTDVGTYNCEARNSFGSIKRTFNIKNTKGCIMRSESNDTTYKPLVLSSKLKWPEEVQEGFMAIPKYDYVVLKCPEKYQTVLCDDDNYLKLNGKTTDYANLKCKNPLKHTVVKSGIPCHSGNTQWMKIVYKIFNKAIELYDICFDNAKNVPLFSKHLLSRSFADTDIKSEWLDSDHYGLDFEDMYDCGRQLNRISRTLGRGFHLSDGCCYKRRPLVSARDMFPGVPQRAAYSLLNVLPHWGTCGSNNWEELERRVRQLARAGAAALPVWTGGAGRARLAEGIGGHTDVTVGEHRVPMYLWKLVQDPASRSSVAIVQVNLPDLDQSEAQAYVTCTDVCDRIEWMRDGDWRDPNRGYTFCCSLADFEKTFSMNGIFDPYYALLEDVSLLPNHSLA